MHGQSKVFAFSYIAQAQVTFVNDIAHLIKSSTVIDHAVALSDSSYVLEAASVAGLSAHKVDAADFATSYRAFSDSEDVFIDEGLDAWFLSFDSTQKLLSPENIELVLQRITTENSLSVFSGEAQPCARFFKQAAFEKDEEFIKSDIQWFNIVTNEMYS